MGETLSNSKPGSRRKWPCAVKMALVLFVCILISVATIFARRMYGTIQAFTSGDNVREISQALAVYAHSHGGHYPDRLGDLFRAHDDIEIAPAKFIVPWGTATPATGATPEQRADQIDAGGHCSYAYLGAGRTEQDITPDTLLMYEADGTNPVGGIYCLFGDGHGEIYTVPQAIDAIVKSVRETDHLATTRPTGT